MNVFQGKVALITGGSSGIGLETARKLAGLGCRVVLAARTASQLDQAVAQIRSDSADAVAIVTDVTNADSCRDAVAKTISTFGKLDILLCSAGLSMRTYFENSDLGAMERVLKVNLFGTLYMTHFALPHVIASRGSLVAVSSLTGKRGVPSYSVYGASKFAVQGLYESLRLEVRRHGVHVGVVAPGFVDTPLRSNVLGPGGVPWEHPPDPPFRVWPVEKCANAIVRLIRNRRREILLPGFMGPLLHLDPFVCNIVGDRVLLWKFPPL